MGCLVCALARVSSGATSSTALTLSCAFDTVSAPPLLGSLLAGRAGSLTGDVAGEGADDAGHGPEDGGDDLGRVLGMAELLDREDERDQYREDACHGIPKVSQSLTCSALGLGPPFLLARCA